MIMGEGESYIAKVSVTNAESRWIVQLWSADGRGRRSEGGGAAGDCEFPLVSIQLVLQANIRYGSFATKSG
jgi:hypothetical protein